MTGEGNIAAVFDALKAKLGWRLDDPLGAGGFAYVFREEVDGLARAVKISKAPHTQRHASRIPELEVARELAGHPRILSLIKYELVHGHLVTVWELAEKTLLDYDAECRAEGQNGISLDYLLRFLAEAAEGIDCLNQRGIYHRDITPRNLFLVKGHVKVGDLGLVKFGDEMSRSHTGAGTYGYLPPEAYEGKLHPTIDRYSLIATYVHLRTGKEPFGTSASEVIDRQRRGEPVVDGMKPEEASWVRQALAGDPNRRPPGTATELVGSLATFLRQDNVRTHAADLPRYTVNRDSLDYILPDVPSHAADSPRYTVNEAHPLPMPTAASAPTSAARPVELGRYFSGRRTLISEQWYYSVGGKAVGPVSAAQLQQMAYYGQLSETDLVWKQGFSDWVPVGEVKHLFAAANPYMPPPVPFGHIPAASIRYAGFWKRFAARFIDWITMLLGGAVISALAGTDEGSAAFVASVMGIIIEWLYYALMESSPTQGTLGKMALGIKVTDLHGNRISFGRATGRYFAKLLSLVVLGIGFLMIAFTEKKQGLHDMIAGCLVVNK